nr:pseudouridine synthase [Brachybacterium sacelli]
MDPVRWVVPPGTAEDAALDALRARFPALDDPEATPLHERFARGEVVDPEGRSWDAGDAVGPEDELWFHRELRDEDVPAAELSILHRDEHLLVLDKPHDMATMPRGAHVLASALVRLRRATGIETLVPLHRLDRRTAGVLAFGIRPEDRPAYQQLFAHGEAAKEYEARVRPDPEAGIPTRPGERATLRDRLGKRHGHLRALVLPGEPNAETHLEVAEVEADGTALLRLRPLTGRTHQLRLQLSSRGAAILGEDLYPEPVDATPIPLQLLARSLAFTDPVTGQERRFLSARELGIPRRGAAAPRTLSP